MEKKIIFLKANLKETIWGGSRLKDFGYELPSGKVGECWAISAHPNGDNHVLNSEFRGKTLSQLWKDAPQLFGRSPDSANAQFPLLTKIIDAASDLSIQVHPDDEYAREHENGSLGKTECWYVLDCAPDSTIIIGHNARDKNQLSKMIGQNQWKSLLREVPVHKGDFFFIEPGTLHAIKGGTLILETQQSSDITYRVYDYDRLSGGKKRDLHIKKSLDVIKCPFEEKLPPLNLKKTANPGTKSLRQLVSSPKFTVWHLCVNGRENFLQDQAFVLASVIEGEGRVDGVAIKKGINFIIPFAYGNVRFEGKMELVLSAV